MLTRRRLLAASAASAVPLVSAAADTPRDVVVIGKQIDDIISLDPGEVFELYGGEVVGNCYDRLLVPDPDNPNALKGDLAERWEVGPDGQTFTFILRPDAKFASGKPVTADDAAFSLQRAIKLNKAPAFILNQFGFSKDNVDDRIVAKDARTLVLTVSERLAPTLVLYCLTANVGCVVERAVALANAQNDDFGNQWLKTNSAGSGSFALRSWKASESVVLDPNPHAIDRARPRRVIVKHIPEPSAQLLQLQRGDVDIARDLQSDQLRAVQNDPKVRMSSAPRSFLLYVAMNQKHPELAKPQVRQAIKWAIDYDGIQKNIAPFTWQVHQSFLPKGFPAEIQDRPFRKDPARARKLLAEAGVPGGFEVTLDHRSSQPEADIAQAVQANLAEIGIKVTLLAGESRQVITRTRARQHQLAQLSWGADYFDPHTNAETFNVNTDNTDAARNRTVAWRSAWQDADFTERAMAASRETDPKARVALYESLQRDHQQRSPFAIMMQSTEFAVVRKNVAGFDVAPLSDRTVYNRVTKSS
jgi:peptide/nickel transport system substrate-binding protein